jgi:transposase
MLIIRLYIIYPENITDVLSIDELSLSKGELYTIITNKTTKRKNKKSLVAIINGTEAKTIEEVLKKIEIEKRTQVKEVSMDMARNMSLAIKNTFPQAIHVIDKFHVIKLVLDALQHVRIKLRWEIIDRENQLIAEAKEKGIKYIPEILSNGDTDRELLARSRYLLYKKESDWTYNQKIRANILFKRFPILKKLYHLSLYFRSIYEYKTKEEATNEFNNWKIKIEELNIKEFNSCIKSLEYYWDKIMNYFDNKSTNAYAESINSKIKKFRQNAKGVVDVRFFLFRLQNLFA